MALRLSSSAHRRTLAIVNACTALAAGAWVVFVLMGDHHEQFNTRALLPFAVPLTMAPWLLFARVWWGDAGWREVALKRPREVGWEASYFLFINAAQLLALPMLASANQRSGWVVTLGLPLLQLFLLGFLRIGLSLWLALCRLLER